MLQAGFPSACTPETRENLNEIQRAERPGHKGAAPGPAELVSDISGSGSGRVSAADTLCGGEGEQSRARPVDSCPQRGRFPKRAQINAAAGNAILSYTFCC